MNRILPLIIIVFISGCMPSSNYMKAQTIQQGAAESVKIQIKMHSGELKVSGGGDALLTAQYYYEVPTLRPEVNYEVIDRQGELVVEQVAVPTIGMFSKEGGANAWDLRLDRDVPIDLSLDFGSGQGLLLLNQISLKRLEVKLGDGQLVIDLTGERQSDLSVRLHIVEGKLKFKLPKDIGVKVNVQRGVYNIKPGELIQQNGSYVNQLFGETDVRMYVDVKSDAGEVIFE